MTKVKPKLSQKFDNLGDIMRPINPEIESRNRKKYDEFSNDTWFIIKSDTLREHFHSFISLFFRFR